jgi:hypothetical protein
MIIKFLDDRLPNELTDIIYRELHRSVMRDISIIIKYKIVFVYSDAHLSFLVCENQNYYCALDVF